MRSIFNALIIILILSTCFQNLLVLPYVDRKIQLTELLFPVVLILFPFAGFKVWKLSKNEKIATFFLCFYLISNVISALLSKEISSLLEAAGRIYLAIFFVILLFYFRQFDNAELKKRVCTIFVLMGALFSVLCLSGYCLLMLNIKTSFLSHYIEYPYLGTIYRVQGPTFTPTMLVTILMTSLFFALPAFYELNWKKSLLLFLSGIILTACILTFSKTLILIFGGIGLWGLRKMGLKKSYLTVYFLFIILISIISTHFVFLTKGSGQYEKYKHQHFFTDRFTVSVGNTEIYETSYLSLKKVAADVFIENPFWGIGPGNFNTEVEKRIKAGDLSRNMMSYDPHSTYLGTLAENGLFGFVTICGFLIFLLAPFLSLIKMKQEPFNLILFLLITSFLIEAISTDILNFRHFWVLSAISFSVGYSKNHQGFSKTVAIE